MELRRPPDATTLAHAWHSFEVLVDFAMLRAAELVPMCIAHIRHNARHVLQKPCTGCGARYDAT